MESQLFLVSTHIRTFVGIHESDRSMERIMADCLPIGGILSHVQRAQLLQMITDMARLRTAHAYVQNHTIMQENPDFATSLGMINDLECLIAAKREKIIELSARTLARSATAYLRSPQFDAERFGRLALERSFSDGELFAKWARLAETVKVASTRLKLLSSILDGVFELFTIVEIAPDYDTLENQARRDNERVLSRFVMS